MRSAVTLLPLGKKAFAYTIVLAKKCSFGPFNPSRPEADGPHFALHLTILSTGGLSPYCDIHIRFVCKC